MNNSDFGSFNAAKETVFIIHGWNSDGSTSMPQSIKNAYLDTRDFNIIVVDWREIAYRNYIKAKNFVEPVSKSIFRMVNLLVDKITLNLNKTAFVGFSMGAHIAGRAGRMLKGKINHITGQSIKRFYIYFYSNLFHSKFRIFINWYSDRYF